MTSTLLRVRGLAETAMVPMDDVKTRHWSHSPTYLATEALNGGTAVALLSKEAGILAHIAPRSPSMNGDEHARALMQEFLAEFKTATSLTRLSRATLLIIGAGYKEEIALPDAINIIRGILVDLGLPIKSEYYQVREMGEPRAVGETSVLLEGGLVIDQNIYVNDKPIPLRGATAVVPKTITPSR